MKPLSTAVVWTVLLVLSCTPPARPKLDPKVHDCVDAASCERALLGAEPKALPRLLASYVAATGAEGWRALHTALTRTEKVPFVGSGTGHIEGVAQLPLPPKTTAVSRAQLLLAIARAAKHPHVLLSENGKRRQLFPLDALAPHMLGLEAVVGFDVSTLPTELALARDTRLALVHAAKFDYVAAAAAADRLREHLSGLPTENEGGMRARFALWLLDSAGIALEAETPLARATPPDALTTPYAELLAVQLARPDHAAAWAARSRRIISGLSAERVRALTQLYAPDDACPAPFAPPIEHTSDVAFAGLFALSLDETAGPGEAPAEGKLGMEAWLERYDALVRHVEASGSAWAALSSLLRQRGELFGLTAEGTAAYKRVTDMALAHVAGLQKLAAAAPTRFPTLGVVTLVYQPGVLSDARLRPAVAKLVQQSVELKIARATTPGALFNAALAAFAAGMSFPTKLQNAQFEGLSRSLEHKLASSFGAAPGWDMAALHLANGALGHLFGNPDALATGADRIVISLSKGVAQPSLARLVTAAASYAKLPAAALDATVQNPAMFTASRKRARAALGKALGGLADAGPRSAPDKQLHQELADLTDTLVAAVASYVNRQSAPRCEGQSAISDDSPLRAVFDRLRKKRKAMLAGHAMSKGDAAWTRRARLLALLASDLIDYLDQRDGKLELTIDAQRAARIVDEALSGWLDHAGAELGSGMYLLARGAVDPDGGRVAIDGTVRALSALGSLFAKQDGSLFATLAKLGRDVGSEGAEDVGALIERYARRAYGTSSEHHGDLLLTVRLAAAVIRDEPVAQSAIDLAKAHGRPVYLPLLMYGPASATRSARLAEAMRTATASGCNPPDPEAVLAVDAAIANFLRGERDAALRALGQVLDDAEARGLAVPRQVFRFEQRDGKKVFNAEQSVSFGNRLLRGGSAFELGLGFQSREAHDGRMLTRFADPSTRAAAEESARYYAHAALVQATYAFVMGRQADATRAARRAIGVWIGGARLGERRIFVGDDTATWSRDATATLVVAGQLAADAGLIFLASDLWTLAKSGLDATASDRAVAAILHPLPDHLAGIDELAPVVKRADDNLTVLARKLQCTDKQGDLAAFVRVPCARYPTALALRAADALDVLPRLKKAGGQPARCDAWGKLDRFLAAADQGRYEPKRLIAALDALTERDLHHDAASLLTRHRHPDHCNPRLVESARKLAAQKTLGMHLRADLLSIATNCAPATEVEADLLALDAVTQQHALPTRNFEALLFATRLALKDNVWAPLAKMSGREHFIRRYNALGPDFGTAALLVHHAAAIGAGNTIDMTATLPFYRLLCTTFPPKERSAMCHAISVMRGGGTAADKKRTAARALADFLQRGARAMARPPP